MPSSPHFQLTITTIISLAPLQFRPLFIFFSLSHSQLLFAYLRRLVKSVPIQITDDSQAAYLTVQMLRVSSTRRRSFSRKRGIKNYIFPWLNWALKIKLSPEAFFRHFPATVAAIQGQQVISDTSWKKLDKSIIRPIHEWISYFKSGLILPWFLKFTWPMLSSRYI